MYTLKNAAGVVLQENLTATDYNDIAQALANSTGEPVYVWKDGAQTSEVFQPE